MPVSACTQLCIFGRVPGSDNNIGIRLYSFCMNAGRMDWLLAGFGALLAPDGTGMVATSKYGNSNAAPTWLCILLAGSLVRARGEVV